MGFDQGVLFPGIYPPDRFPQVEKYIVWGY